MTWLKGIGLLLALLLTGPLLVVSCGKVKLGEDWQTADRSGTGIAPDPATTREAVVQVYSARAFDWRGIFAVHTWVATKRRDADHYTVHQVVGWRAYRNLPVVVSSRDLPDRAWYGYTPEIIADRRGAHAEVLIEPIERAVASYPFPRTYRVWPGPNSNTFTAHVGREVPALGLDLPVTAIGKDYLTGGRFLDAAPSGTGWQLSLRGLGGVILAPREGLEINILGLNLGVDAFPPAIKLPGIGRLGMR